MLQKLRLLFFNLFVILLLTFVLLIFVVNIKTNELNFDDVSDFLKQSTTKSREFEPSDFIHQIGKEIFDSQYEGEVIKVVPLDYRTDGQNYVNIGPMIFLLPGKYILTYDIAVSNIKSNENFAIIDVFRAKTGQLDEKILNSSDFNQDFKKEKIEFETDGGAGYEFRLYYQGEGELKAGEVTIENVGRSYSLLVKKVVKVLIR